MKKANKSWSDPALLQEAAKENATPEILQVRKMNRQLYVKPPTPPPPPPPKPKMDQSLVNNLRSNHGRLESKTAACLLVYLSLQTFVTCFLINS